MRRSRPQTSSMYIVSVEGVEFDYFNNFRFTFFSGIKDETKMIPYESPFLHREFSIPTTRRYMPVELSMPYSADEHNTIFNAWNSYENQPLTIIIEPVIGCQVSGEETSKGYVHKMTGCIWNKCETADVDRENNKITKLTISFTITKAEEVQI